MIRPHTLRLVHKHDQRGGLFWALTISWSWLLACLWSGHILARAAKEMAIVSATFKARTTPRQHQLQTMANVVESKSSAVLRKNTKSIGTTPKELQCRGVPLEELHVLGKQRMAHGEGEWVLGELYITCDRGYHCKGCFDGPNWLTRPFNYVIL